MDKISLLRYYHEVYRWVEEADACCMSAIVVLENNVEPLSLDN